MPDPIINYPLDVSGVNPNNLVQNEFHAITPIRRGVVMNYGPFFEQGVVVRNAATNETLTPGDDYVVALIYQAATFAIKKAIYCVIVVNDLNITGILVNYQVVGGEYTRFTGAIQELLDQIALDESPVEWGSILGTPNGFVPLPHQHPAYQIHSYGALIAAVDRIRQAIFVGNQTAIGEMYDYINSILTGSIAPVASDLEALTGEDTQKRIVPSNLKYVIDTRLAALNIPSFDYEVDEVDGHWGYWRHRESGFTVCMGTTVAIASGEAFRVFFRRRFTNIPNIAGSFINTTTDTTPSGTGWVEVTGGIVEHTRSNEGFYVAANRINGTGNDKVRFSYIAVGYSAPDAALAASEGAIGIVPPAAGTLEQPVWSGTNTISLVTGPTGTERFGLIFTSSTPGGGYTFNTNTQTPLSTIYYTPYPGQFVDNDYEVYVTAGVATVNPNLTYAGLALDTWHDLAVIRALDPTLASSGFTFTTSGLYGGTITLTVTIRKKTDNAKTATRVFTLDRDSTVGKLRIGSGAGESVGTSAGYNVYVVSPTTSTKNSKVLMEIANSMLRLTANRPDGGLEGYANVYTKVNPGLADLHPSAWSGLDTTKLADYEARALYTPNTNGFVLGAGSLAVVPSNTTSYTGGWTEIATVLGSVNGWMVSTSATNNGSTSILVQLRHKTDWRKVVHFSMGLVRIGQESLAAWSGTTSANIAVASGSLVTFEVLFPTNMADGVGEMRYSVNGSYSSSSFTYALGKSSWNDSIFSVSYISSSSGNTFTAGGNANYQGWTSLGNSLSYTWQATITQPSSISASFSVADSSVVFVAGAAVSQGFSLNITMA